MPFLGFVTWKVPVSTVAPASTRGTMGPAYMQLWNTDMYSRNNNVSHPTWKALVLANTIYISESSLVKTDKQAATTCETC